MKRHIAAAALGCTAVFAAPLTAQAALDFNNLHVSYLMTDAENDDGDGFGALLNFEVTDNFFITTAYSTRSFDTSEIDSELFHAGLGFKMALNESGTLLAYGMAMYEETSFDYNGATSGTGGGTGGGGTGETEECSVLGLPLVDDLLCLLGFEPPEAGGSQKAFVLGDDETTIDGYGLQAGIRWEAMQNLELNASIGAREYDDYDDTIMIYNAGAAYSLGSWTLFANYDIRDFGDGEWEEILTGVRWDFGKE